MGPHVVQAKQLEARQMIFMKFGRAWIHTTRLSQNPCSSPSLSCSTWTSHKMGFSRSANPAELMPRVLLLCSGWPRRPVSLPSWNWIRRQPKTAIMATEKIPMARKASMRGGEPTGDWGLLESPPTDKSSCRELLVLNPKGRVVMRRRRRAGVVVAHGHGV